MAVDTDFSLAMSDGIASVAPTGTAAPDDLTTLTTPWVDLGALTTDGLVQAMGETRTDFKRWGSIAKYKSVVTDVAFTFDVAFLESNSAVLGLFYKVTDPAPDGTTNIVTVDADTTGKQDVRSWVFDVMEGTNHIRFYLPTAEITARKNVTYKTDTQVEYGVTVTAYPDDSGSAVQVIGLLDANVA